MHPFEQAVAAALCDTPRIEPGISASARFRFPKDFIGFSGHFPGYPLLPAFIQIACASGLVRLALPPGRSPVILEKAKFMMEIHPGDEIRIECTRLSESGPDKWKAAIYTEDALAAAFQLTLQETGNDRE